MSTVCLFRLCNADIMSLLLPEVTVGAENDVLMSDEYEEGGEEGPWDDSEDEEANQKMYGMYQALPVVGEPDWSEAEPSTAEEYLRRVQYERARCPGIVRVEPDPGKLQQAEQQQQQQQQQAQASTSQQQQPARRARGALPPQQEIMDAPDWAQPSPAWLQDFVGSFEALRLELQDAAESQPASDDWPSLPDTGDAHAWERHCFTDAARPSGGTADASSSGAVTGLREPQSGVSSISPHIYGTVMQLDTVGVAELFELHVEQLLKHSTKSMDPLRAQWLFALAARLEKPLLPDTLAALRSLLRHCASIRAELIQGSDASVLPLLNVLICVAGAYYGQDEQLCKLAAPDFQALA